jgi:arylsulfatase
MLTADLEVPEAGAEGMIAKHGGYGPYVRDNKPTFVYNYLAVDRFTFASKEPLPKGKVQLKVVFASNGGGGFGKGAAVTMRVNDTKVAEGQLPKTIPIQISPGKGLHIGMDVGSAVDFTYQVPFQFIGRIKKVTVYWSTQVHDGPDHADTNGSDGRDTTRGQSVT